jgi:hypothetical protein
MGRRSLLIAPNRAFSLPTGKQLAGLLDLIEFSQSAVGIETWFGK